MTVISATELRKHIHTVMDELAESHEPIQIHGKQHSAVLISEEDWRAMQETLYLLGIPGMRESIREGLKETVDHCMKETTRRRRNLPLE